MKTSTVSSETLPEKSWQLAINLASQTDRNQLDPHGPFTLHPETVLIEPAIWQGVYHEEKISSMLLRDLRALDEELQSLTRETGLAHPPYHLTAVISLLDSAVQEIRHSLAHHANQEAIEELLVPLLDIMRFLWVHHRDASLGLFFSQGAFDAFELTPSTPESRSRNCPLYPNLYFYLTLQQLLPSLSALQQAEWAPHLQELKSQIVQRFLIADSTGILNQIPLDSDSPFATVQWNYFAPHCLALFLASGIADAAKTHAVSHLLHEHLRKESSGTFGMAFHPAAPSEIQGHFQFRGWTHVPGANHSQLCAHSARILYRAGQEELAHMILQRIVKRISEDGGIYPWYTPDHCPQGSRPDPCAARAFLNAIAEIEPKWGRTFAQSSWKAEVRHSMKEQVRRKSSLSFRPRKVSFAEKRNARRVPVTLNGTLLKKGFLGKDDPNISVRFPSSTGLALQTRQELKPGGPIHLGVRIRRKGKTQTVKLHGHVCWTQPKVHHLVHQYGVELDAGKGNYEDWDDFIQNLLVLKKHPTVSISQ